ncbi:MAG: LytTR family DNA-binding domain-containing protein [Bacteroidales bacterium]|jgi:DNA-binding LytR/AlgR family response regulator|nr:LytTR family DNA-binding domain-containing protein [Bacteroidales bacterium]
MNVLIIEDEHHTANRLKQLITELDSTTNIITILSSVESAIEWFKNNTHPDLIFQDIALSDGNCFEIYEEVDVKSPIIFTTAYSEYALKSFKFNSIDYIVKPYDKDDINRVLNKFRQFSNMFTQPNSDIIKDILKQTKKTVKKRFLVRTGDKYRTIKTTDVAYLMYDEGVVFAITQEAKHPVDSTITELDMQLDGDIFFRINRKYIVNINSITKISSWFNSRLKLELTPPANEDIVVSRERVKEFKEWLDY